MYYSCFWSLIFVATKVTHFPSNNKKSKLGAPTRRERNKTKYKQSLKEIEMSFFQNPGFSNPISKTPAGINNPNNNGTNSNTNEIKPNFFPQPTGLPFFVDSANNLNIVKTSLPANQQLHNNSNLELGMGNKEAPSLPLSTSVEKQNAVQTNNIVDGANPLQQNNKPFFGAYPTATYTAQTTTQNYSHFFVQNSPPMTAQPNFIAPENGDFFKNFQAAPSQQAPFLANNQGSSPFFPYPQNTPAPVPHQPPPTPNPLFTNVQTIGFFQQSPDIAQFFLSFKQQFSFPSQANPQPIPGINPITSPITPPPFSQLSVNEKNSPAVMPIASTTTVASVTTPTPFSGNAIIDNSNLVNFTKHQSVQQTGGSEIDKILFQQTEMSTTTITDGMVTTSTKNKVVQSTQEIRTNNSILGDSKDSAEKLKQSQSHEKIQTQKAKDQKPASSKISSTDSISNELSKLLSIEQEKIQKIEQQILGYAENASIPIEKKLEDQKKLIEQNKRTIDVFQNKQNDYESKKDKNALKKELAKRKQQLSKEEAVLKDMQEKFAIEHAKKREEELRKSRELFEKKLQEEYEKQKKKQKEEEEEKERLRLQSEKKEEEEKNKEKQTSQEIDEKEKDEDKEKEKEKEKDKKKKKKNENKGNSKSKKQSKKEKLKKEKEEDEFLEIAKKAAKIQNQQKSQQQQKKPSQQIPPKTSSEIALKQNKPENPNQKKQTEQVQNNQKMPQKAQPPKKEELKQTQNQTRESQTKQAKPATQNPQTRQNSDKKQDEKGTKSSSLTEQENNSENQQQENTIGAEEEGEIDEEQDEDDDDEEDDDEEEEEEETRTADEIRSLPGLEEVNDETGSLTSLEDFDYLDGSDDDDGSIPPLEDDEDEDEEDVEGEEENEESNEQTQKQQEDLAKTEETEQMNKEMIEEEAKVAKEVAEEEENAKKETNEGQNIKIGEKIAENLADIDIGISGEEVPCELKEKGNNLIRIGQLDQAIAVYQLAVEKHKENQVMQVKLHFNLAIASLMKNDFDKAIEMATKAIQASKRTHVKSIIIRADANLELKNFSDSLDDYRIARYLSSAELQSQMRLKEKQQSPQNMNKINEIDNNINAARGIVEDIQKRIVRAKYLMKKMEENMRNLYKSLQISEISDYKNVIKPKFESWQVQSMENLVELDKEIAATQQTTTLDSKQQEIKENDQQQPQNTTAVLKNEPTESEKKKKEAKDLHDKICGAFYLLSDPTKKKAYDKIIFEDKPKFEDKPN